MTSRRDDDYASELFGVDTSSAIPDEEMKRSEGDVIATTRGSDVTMRARMFVFTRSGFHKFFQLLLVSLHFWIVCYSMGWRRSFAFVMLVLVDSVLVTGLLLSIIFYSSRYSPHRKTPDLVNETRFNASAAFLTTIGCLATFVNGGYLIYQIHFQIISLLLFLFQWSLEFRKSFGLYPWGGTGFFDKTPLGRWAKSLCRHPVEQKVVHLHYHIGGDGKLPSSFEKSLGLIGDLKLEDILKKEKEAVSQV